MNNFIEGKIPAQKAEELNLTIPFRTIEEHSSQVTCLCFIDGNRFCSCSIDEKIKIWSLDNYQCIGTLESDTGFIYISKLSDGHLISSDFKGEIQVWDIDNLECLYASEYDDLINKICEISDNRICSCSFDKTMIIFDNYSPYQQRHIIYHKYPVYSFIELKTAKHIMSCSYIDNSYEITVWNNQSYQREAVITNLKFSFGNQNMLELDDNRVAIGGIDFVHVIDTKTFQVRSQISIEDSFIDAVVEVGNGLILCGCSNGSLYQVDVNKNKVVSSNSTAHGSNIKFLLILSNAAVVSCSNDHTIKIWK